MIIPFRLLPLLLFSLFVALALLTEQIGQRLYQPVDAFLGASCVLMIGLGLRRCETWSWWCCVLLWPFQLLMIGTLILLAVVARTLDPAGGLAIVSPLEVALSGAQIIALAAAWLCLLAPSIRAGFVEPLSARPLVNVACYALIVLGLMAVALRGTAIERVGAIASVVADRPGVQRAVDAPADIIWDGAIVDRAASTAAAYRVTRHACAAEAAVWHSLEVLEAGIAGAVSRDEAVRGATAAVLLARREIAATFVAVEDLRAASAGAGEVAEVATSVERWAAAMEGAAGLAAATAPLITASEVAPGNAAWGLVPALIEVQETRSRAIADLSGLVPQTILERALLRHFAAVSDALGDINDLVPSFVDRGGAAVDLAATAERLWIRTLPRLSTTELSVVGLADTFRRHEREIRAGIGVPLMESAFLPVLANYEATGALAPQPTNAFLSLRARLLESARLDRQATPMIVPLLRSARIALAAVAEQAALSETRMGYLLDAVGEAGV
jgi:hypothetical protein